MPKRSSKRRPREKDAFQIAKSILGQVPPDAKPVKEAPARKEKNPAAFTLGRRGGNKGGKSRAGQSHASQTQGYRQ